MITSAQNAQIRRIEQLNTKAKARRETGLFTAEGVKLFRETPPERRRRVYVSETFFRGNHELLEGLPEGMTEVVEDRIFSRICDTKTPQGILTVAEIPRCGESALLGGDSGREPLVVVLENLQDPGNLGTIIRTAEGAGATGILMNSGTADPYQPKVVRATMGTIFRVPIVRTEDVLAAVRRLKAAGITTYAAHLRGSADYSEPDYRRGTAFLIGNEGNGLTDELAAEADVKIRIPMEGQLESLNAAVASAILLYTAHRKRHTP